MKNKHKHLITKVFLVLLAELVLVIAVNLTSKYIISIPSVQSSYIYILLGGIIAFFVSSSYDKMIERKKRQAKKQVRELKDITLRKFMEKEDDYNRDQHK